MKIALCGTGGSGKTKLIQKVRDSVETWCVGNEKDLAKHPSVVSLGSATRETARLYQVGLCEEGNDRTQLYSQMVRRHWLATSQAVDWVFSERSGLDEVGYQAVRIKSLVAGSHELRVAAAYLDVLYTNFVEDEVDLWDLICFKPRHLGYEIESDGVRSLDEEYVMEVEATLANYVSQLKVFFPQKFLILDPEIEVAHQQIVECLGIIEPRLVKQALVSEAGHEL